MFWDNANTGLGIGTAAPSTILHTVKAVGTSETPDSTTASFFGADSTAQAAGVGGTIVLSGKFTDAGGYLSSGPFIKAYKLNGTTGNYSFGLKLGTRENGVGNSAVRMTIDPTGNVGIGTTAPSYKLEVVTQNNATSGVIIGNASSIYSTPASSSSAFICGGQWQAEKNGAQNLTGAWGSGGLIGGMTKAVNRNTGTVTNAYGFVPDCQNITAGGTITNAHQFYIPNPYVAAGAITNAYGIKIENITSGGTLNYSIYTGTAQSYFGGKVGIGTTAPAYSLDVSSTTAIATSIGANVLHRNNGNSTAITGFKTQATHANGTNDYLTGAHYDTAIYATSSNSTVGTQLTGFNTRAVYYGTGAYDISIAKSVVFNIQAPNISMGTGSVSCTTAYGIEIGNQGFTGVTTAAGLYIASQIGALTNYAIYAAGGNSYHASNFGFGTATSPSALIHGTKTTEQLRLGYDTSNYYSTTVGSTGIVTFNAVGAGAAFVFSDTVQASGFKSSDGSAGLSQDVTVRNAVGDGTTTLTFKNGLLTAVA